MLGLAATAWAQKPAPESATVDKDVHYRVPPVDVRYDDGFRLETDDGAYALTLNGRVQADTRFFSYSDTSPYDRDPSTDLLDINRARLEFRATVDELFEAKVSAEFTDSPALKDAYINLAFAEWAELKIGQYQYPFGAENFGSSKYREFMEKAAISSATSAGRDRGFNLHGQPLDKIFFYQVGILAGAGENTRDNNSAVDFVGRISINPTRNFGDFFQIFLGGSFNYGEQRSIEDDKVEVETETGGGATLFKAVFPEDIDYDRTRFGVDWTALLGSFMFQGELLSASYGFEDTGTISGGFLTFSLFLTGEQRNIKHGLTTQQDVEYPIGGGEIGAWELAARYSWFNVSDAFFTPNQLIDGWAGVDINEYVDNGGAWTLGVNWYPNRMTRIMANWVISMAPDIESTDETWSIIEQAFLMRLQLEF